MTERRETLHDAPPGRASRLHGTVAVVSPHCDDAVLSLGAALAAHARAGGRAVVVTVLAGDPDARFPAGPWDASAGFRTAQEATLTRRAEDAAACARVAVAHRHVDAVDEQYRSGGVPAGLWGQVEGLLEGCDEVLLPGFPLRHPDHVDVTRLVLRGLATHRPVRLYAEEPYALREGVRRFVDLWGTTVCWGRLPATAADSAAKLQAVRCYRSQVRVLGPRRLPSPSAVAGAALLAQLWRAARRRGEWVTEPVAAGRLTGEAPGLRVGDR